MLVCVSHVCSAHGGHKRALGPLELELQMVVSHHVSAKNGTESPARAVSALNHGAISPVFLIMYHFLPTSLKK